MIQKSRFVTYVTKLNLIIWYYLNCKTWNRFCMFSITVQCNSVTLLCKNDTKITVILTLLLLISARFLQYCSVMLLFYDLMNPLHLLLTLFMARFTHCFKFYCVCTKSVNRRLLNDTKITF